MAFGDQPENGYTYDNPFPNNSVYKGDMNGKHFEPGVYNFEAKFYSENNLKGTVVRTISFKLYVETGACRVSSSAGIAGPEKLVDDGRRLRGKLDDKE